MIASGAVEEAANLIRRDLDPRLPVMKAVALRELAAAAAGEAPLAAAAQAARLATRHYAKRQLTWFRHQAADWPRIDADDAEAQWGQFLALIGDLTTPGARGM
jgi:tRNA dimethylallyltransferase